MNFFVFLISIPFFCDLKKYIGSISLQILLFFFIIFLKKIEQVLLSIEKFLFLFLTKNFLTP